LLRASCLASGRGPAAGDHRRQWQPPPRQWPRGGLEPAITARGLIDRSRSRAPRRPGYLTAGYRAALRDHAWLWLWSRPPLRQAAGDGGGRMLVKSTAPSPQPRQAGSTAIHKISAPPGGRRAATAKPAWRIWQRRGSAWPGPACPGHRGAGTVLAVAGNLSTETGVPARLAMPTATGRPALSPPGAWRRRIDAVPVLVAVAHPARRRGHRHRAACRRGTPPQACQPPGAATACGSPDAGRHQDPTSV